MKLKHTLILLAIAIGIFAYLVVDWKMPTAKEKAEKKGRLFEFDRDKISAITIKTPEGKIELKKDGKDWHVQTPVKDRADTSTVTTLLTNIETIRTETSIDDKGKAVSKEQLKEYGITDSPTKLTVTVDGKPVELLFGKDTTIENRVYAYVEGSKTVEVVPNSLKTEISKKADEFRDKKLSDLTLAQINKAVIKTNAGEIEVERKNDHWSLVRPLKARGDDAKIGDTISQAITSHIDAFVPDTSKLGEYGLDQPRGTITLTVEGQQQPQVLSIGGNPKEEKDKEKVYAKLSSRDAVVLLPKTVASLLDIKPNDLRDRKLLDFNSDMVDRITIEPAGKEKLVFARDGAKGWVRKADNKDIAINSAVVSRLLDDLGSAPVSNFVSDVATELPKYSLDQPGVKVTLSAFSSENTAETKAGEKPITTLLLGKFEGQDVYARLDDQPFIVSTPKTLLESIPTDATQVQPLEIFNYKADDIVWFEVSREGLPTLSFERDKDKNWKLAKGDDKINPINVQSLVNALASLRAVRWTGATTPEHGFAKPTATVSFKTASNATGKLTFGGVSPEQMRYAKADGLNGTFIVPTPDFEAFVTSLTDKPTAVPASGAAPAGADGNGKPEAATAPVPAPVPAPAEPAKPAAQ